MFYFVMRRALSELQNYRRSTAVASNTWPKASNTYSHSLSSPILKPLFIIKIMLSATNHSHRENSRFIQCRKISQSGLQAPAHLFPDKCTLTLYHTVPISSGQQSPKDQQNLFTWHGYYSLAGNLKCFLHWSMPSIFSSKHPSGDWVYWPPYALGMLPFPFSKERQ